MTGRKTVNRHYRIELTQGFFTAAGIVSERRMTPLEETLERPEFELLDLDVDTDEADQYIEEAIKGLSASKAGEGVKYRTTGGMLVAIVGPRHTGSGDVKAKLAYRTAPASESATRKASKIRDALEPHAINR